MSQGVELLFLGAGAGEFWPSPFCPCEACRKAVSESGAQARIGACLLIDRALLFDLPPNAGLAAAHLGISLSEVRHLFVTHSHQDHFEPCTLAAAGRVGGPMLHLYCNQRVAQLLPVYAQFNRFFCPEKLNLDIHALQPSDTARNDEFGLVLQALAAAHDTTAGEQPLIYILEYAGRTILYACDTGWFPEPTWAAIERQRYDAVVLDCTMHLLQECRSGHLSLGPFLEVHERFRQRDLLKPGAHFIAQHLLQPHGRTDDIFGELTERLRPHHIEVARDGMRIVI